MHLHRYYNIAIIKSQVVNVYKISHKNFSDILRKTIDNAYHMWYNNIREKKTA